MQDCRTNDTIRKMIERTIIKEGITSLYSGLKFDMIRVIPSNAITFVTYEYLKKSSIMKNLYVF